MDTEVDYLFRRAREEVVHALRANHPNAMRAHKDLSVQYVARARQLLQARSGWIDRWKRA